MNIILPDYVNKIIETLKRANHRAYAVGGCVRDAVMGKTPTDYDIATSATPDEVRSLFSHTVATGERFGTITVLIDKKSAEVTTFRSESGYSDCRHPTVALGGVTLRDDASRRDFTVNALCYNNDEGLIDFFGGLDDINSKTIRTVGIPAERFAEDALRILRAVRFSAALDFDIESETMVAMISAAKNLEKISAERIREELCKTLMSNSPDALNIVLMAQGLEHMLLKSSSELSKVAMLSLNKQERLSAFFLLCSDNIKKSAELLRLSNKEKDEILSICDATEKQLLNDRIHIKRLMQAHSAEAVKAAARIRSCLYDDENALDCVMLVNDIIASNEPYSLKGLAVNGNDILALGDIQPSEIGRILNFLLDCCIGTPALNEKDTLLGLAKSYIGG